MGRNLKEVREEAPCLYAGQTSRQGDRLMPGGSIVVALEKNKEAVAAGVQRMRGGGTGNGAREMTRLNGIGPDRQL